MACEITKYVGRDVILRYAIGCGDARPSNSDFLLLGAMRTKEVNIEWDTTDATADDSIGAIRDNLATFLGFSISGDGVCRATDNTAISNQVALLKHVANPVQTSGQPYAWIEVTFPDVTFTCFMLVNNFSRSAPYDDVVTYSFEAMAANSEFGLIIEDTPTGSTPATLTAAANPASIAANGTSTSLVSATVKDADGNNVGAGVTVTWSKTGGGTLSAASTATNSSGVASVTVTSPTTAGSSTVTATSGAATGNATVTFT